MLVRIIRLTVSLLSCYLTRWSTIHLSIWPRCTAILTIRIDCISIIKSLLLLLGTLFEKHFPQDIFFLLVRVVVLHVVVMGLVENAVGVVVAIWILVSYSSCLAYRVGIDSAYHVVGAATIDCVLSVLTVRALAGNQQYSFVKATNYWYFWWLLR